MSVASESHVSRWQAGYDAHKAEVHRDMAELELYRGLERTPRGLLDILKEFVFTDDAAAEEDSE